MKITAARKLAVDFFSKGHQRTIQAKRNILASFLVKGVSIGTNLALIPLTISYINPTRYGIWLTLTSVIAWFSFFDIGFGHGLRNRFAEARADGNTEKARIYLSTTYAVLVLIFLAVFVLFFTFNLFADWSIILNAPSKMASELKILALIIFSFFCLNMILKTVNTVLLADQKPAKAAFFDMIAKVIILIIIYILTKTTDGSLILLGFTISSAPILVFIFSTIWLFNKEYREVAPSLRLVDFRFARDILTLGSKFFFIQIGVIIIFQTNNLVIAQVGTPEDVTIFNVAYKYCAIALMGFSIIISPYWSAFTEAYSKKDFKWMQKTVKTLRKISYLLVVGVIILIIVSEHFYKFWVGSMVNVPFAVTIVVGMYIILLAFTSLNTQILNGLGKIKVQLFSYSLATLFHIPIALLLGREFGILGVLLSACFFYCIIASLAFIQVNMLISNKAHGWWTR